MSGPEVKKEADALLGVFAILPSVEKFLAAIEGVAMRAERAKISVYPGVTPSLSHGKNIVQRIKSQELYTDAFDDILELTREIENLNAGIGKLNTISLRVRKVKLTPFPLKTFTKYILY